VATIPHTLERTTLAQLSPGRRSTVEVDVLGKYVERLLGRAGQTGGVTMELLANSGFVR